MTTIARRIIARLHPSRFSRDGEYRTATKRLVEHGIGGFCIFDGTIEEVQETIGTLRAAAEYPLVFAIDAETGLGMRLEDCVEFPHAWALGLQSPSVTERVASAIAESLRDLGIVWNFAPVADVATNPSNPIIGIRAFGASPPLVVTHVQAWIRAHERQGVAACAKHFPGHGDSCVDSHVELPTITAPLEVLIERELVPYYAAIKEGVTSIMVGHLSVPAIGVPRGELASMSSAAIRGLLRERLGYNGIIVTDALDMQPVTQRYGSGEAVVAALSAGADVALVPADPVEAIEHAKRAATILSEEEHRAALERIERMSARSAELQHAAVSQSELADLALTVASGALRLAGDRSVLPLTQYAHIAAFAVVADDDPLDAPTEFFRYLAQLYPGNMDVAFLTPSIDADDAQAHIAGTADAECVVVAVFQRPRAYGELLRRCELLERALEQLSVGKRRVLLVAGSPQVELSYSAETVIWTFSDRSPSCAAAALLLVQGTSSSEL